ncbi:glutathione S-transferase family protein [Roseibium sp. Sym1]|uniref:glutathione S-transferase family protein n=1 Tax=Roseibium sp. Sym1 TaxID=3016006 RepID=UPI0022B3EAAD|nr:glutathione S-transferase [Roseibium sp. Sym1]
MVGMKLHWSGRSPFVRKVMIVLHETGLLETVELSSATVALHLPPSQELLADNPLGKIPALVIENGQVLFDSRVICEYLDNRADGGMFPKSGPARYQQLRWQALGDGLADILLIWRTELLRETGSWEAVTDGWLAKTRAAMSQLERDADELGEHPFGIGQISVVCALGQMDARWPDCDWRNHFPALAALEVEWRSRPSVKATAIVHDGETGRDSLTAGHLTFGG